MQNDPELQVKGKYLGSITADFVHVAKILQEASYQIRIRKISDYPIFPISKEGLPVGQVLIEKSTKNLSWNYNISFLEEFEQRELVTESDGFKAVYKKADDFCCLFVVDKEFTNFVFVPYPEEEE